MMIGTNPGRNLNVVSTLRRLLTGLEGANFSTSHRHPHLGIGHRYLRNMAEIQDSLKNSVIFLLCIPVPICHILIGRKGAN